MKAYAVLKDRVMKDGRRWARKGDTVFELPLDHPMWENPKVWAGEPRKYYTIVSQEEGGPQWFTILKSSLKEII